jgi:PEP-CTERM motif
MNQIQMKRISQSLACTLLFSAGALSLALPARADVFQDYAIAWSGAPNGNTATAVGTMNLDLTTLPNPEPTYTDIITSIQSLSITVSGSGGGDGTFTKADLAPESAESTNTYWFTNGATLNMEGDVLAQLLADSGDFNLFFGGPDGPEGSFVLQLQTDQLQGDVMNMTKFAATPEPSAYMLALVGAGLFGLVKVARRKSQAAL